LHGILGIVMTEHACSVAIQGTLEPNCELFECASVAAARALEKCSACFFGPLPHQRSFARS
jgi:hypothetical protein